jgi:hypothetical protein
MSILTINLEGDVNDRLRSMRYLIEHLSPLRKLSAGQSAVVDLSKVHYLGPDGAVMIAGSILEARQRQVAVRLVMPSGPVPLVAFLEFSGFNHLLQQSSLPELDHPENVTVPLRQFRQSRHTDPDPILHLIGRFEPISDDLRLSLEIAVNECVQNIEDHSRSDLGGLCCARFMTRDREIRVALVDWGEGIRTSLQRRYNDIQDDVDALQRVLYGGYSAKTRPNNLGRGIDNLRSVVTQALGGNLYLISGNASADFQGRRSPRYDRLQYGFQGTAVCFTLPVRPKD